VTNQYCTLFDARYLPRGLVLYESLRKVCPSACLTVLCMDETTKRVLDALALPALTAVPVEELEAHDRDLAAVRPTRSRVEYCWTATASFCLYCLERDETPELITYLDADLKFYADPGPAFTELGTDSILLVPHRYARRWQWLERASGPYNVQWVTFRRDPDGLAALRWWRQRCIEWCYSYVEDGRFGDQRYLDDWPERFSGVRVLAHPGAGLGPWSSGRYRVELRDGAVRVEDRPLLFHHFHGLRVYPAGAAVGWIDRAAGARPLRVGDLEAHWASDFPLTRVEHDAIWHPYAELVARQTERVCSLAPQLRGVIQPGGDRGIVRRLALRAPRPLPSLVSHALRLGPRGERSRTHARGKPDRALGALSRLAI
jgi:hypothetical protein